MANHQAQQLCLYLQENPVWQSIYELKQELCELLTCKACNQRKCVNLECGPERIRESQ